MDEGSIANLQKKLDLAFGTEYINQRSYSVSFDLLKGKHVSATGQEAMGEMLFQQFVYNLFSGLLLSACYTEAKNYKADELVTASLPCKYRDTAASDWKDGDFRIKPDAASTMHNGCDPFAMMELKPPRSSNEDVLFDQEKCIAMLSSTLISLNRFKVDTDRLYLPFIIGRGYDACLYIVHLGQYSETNGSEKIPKVFMVGSYYDLKADKTRAQLFVILSALLHNVKRILEQNEEPMKSYHTYIVSNTRQRNPNNPFASTSKRKSTEKSDTTTPKRPRSHGDENNQTKDNRAANAARCDGLFDDIKLPWPRPITFGEEDVEIFYQAKSPYYFLGTSSKSGKRCFLKIWQEEDEGFYDVIDEFKFLKQAQDCGVKVAQLMTNELVNVTVDSIKFNVLATEYIESSPVMSIDELFSMALSLMEVVVQLHEQAGVLHCDIKPDNIRWDSSNQQAYLIDFGHAQMANRARHYNATKDFEAPEIREKKLPHSRASDTFSVGASILWFCDDYFQGMRMGENDFDSRMGDLRAVGGLLTAPLSNRKTLREGIAMLGGVDSKLIHDDRVINSCGKRPRLVDTIG
jgi:hypothetical protein